MFKNALTKALRLEAPTLQAFSFCEKGNEASFDQWLESLPVMDSASLIERLYTALKELAEMKLRPNVHFSYLESILPKVAECKPILEKTYLRRSVDASNSELKALEIAQAFDGFTLVAYARVLVGGLSNKKDMAIVVSRILEAAFDISVRCGKLYLEIPRHTWSYLYQVHEFADNKGLLYQKIDLMFRELSEVTPHNLFLQSILLACAGTMQLQPNQLTELVSVLPRMAESVTWGLLKNFPQAMFMVNVLDFRPPVYLGDHQSNSRYIKAVDVSPLVLELTQTFDNPYVGKLSDEIKAHLERLWAFRPVRQGRRRQHNSRVELLPGIHKNFGALVGGKTPTQFIMSDFPGEWLESKIRFEQSQKIEFRIFRGELDDVSEDEIGARATIQGFPPGLCSGDLISLNSGDGIRIGLVRWLRVVSRSSCQVGLQFISLNIQPCAIQGLSPEGYWSDPSAALLSLTEMDGEPRPKLICHRPSFEKAISIRLFAQKRIAYVQLVGKEHITGSVLVASFRQVDPNEWAKAKDFASEPITDLGRETLNNAHSPPTDDSSARNQDGTVPPVDYK